MPTLRCRCKTLIDYGRIPCEHEWLLISDVAMEKFSGKVDAEHFYRAAQGLLRCPQCETLWVFWNGFAGEATEYGKK